MTHSTYNVNRDDAAQMLDISTRTLDRYIRKGKLSYKKISNKVFLSEQEIENFKNNQQKVQRFSQESELIGNSDYVSQKKSEDKSIVPMQQIENMFDNKMGEYIKLLKDKDTTIEEKNKIIYALQQSIVELEEKLNNSIALPDYTKEKENFHIEKEKIELEKENIKEDLNKEKINNSIYLIVVIILLIIFGFMMV